MSGLDQVSRHRRAHNPEPYYSDRLRHPRLSLEGIVATTPACPSTATIWSPGEGSPHTRGDPESAGRLKEVGSRAARFGYQPGGVPEQVGPDWEWAGRRRSRHGVGGWRRSRREGIAMLRSRPRYRDRPRCLAFWPRRRGRSRRGRAPICRSHVCGPDLVVPIVVPGPKRCSGLRSGAWRLPMTSSAGRGSGPSSVVMQSRAAASAS